MRLCSYSGCERKHHSHGYCQRHVVRSQRGLSMDSFMRIVGDDQQRWWSKVDRRDEGCWEWTGPRVNGYGRFSTGGKSSLAYRWGYEQFVAPVEPERQLDHLCRNRACVRFDHLEPVTSAENTRRGQSVSTKNAAKTHCPQSHPYDETNTVVVSGSRRCRTCARESSRRRMATKVRAK